MPPKIPSRSRRSRRRKVTFQSNQALIFQNDAIAHYTLMYLQNLLNTYPTITLQDHNIAEKLINLLLTHKNHSDITKFVKNYEDKLFELQEEAVDYGNYYSNLFELFNNCGSKELYEDGLSLFDSYFSKELARTKKQRNKIDDKLSSLKKLFNLSNIEEAFLRALYIYETSDLIDDVHRVINDAIDIRSSRGSSDIFVVTIPAMLGITQSEVLSLISNSGQLKKMGILDSDNDMASEINDFISGITSTPLISRYYRLFDKKALPISYFNRLKKEIGIITALIKNRTDNTPINILLYGIPGTGKTAFTHAIAKSLKRNLFEVRINGENGRGGENNNLFRKRAIAAAMNSSSNKDILMIDEADSLLNSSSNSFFGLSINDSVKEQVNEMLDRIPRVTFWITNRQNGMDSSTSRRMDFSIRFEPLNTEERAVIWKNAVKALGITEKISNKQYLEWATKYETSAGGITLALRNALLLSKENSVSFVNAVDLIIRPHLKIMGKKLAVTKSKNSHYSLDAINVKNDSLPEIIESVSSFVDRIKEGEELIIPNYNILLYGVPGTGKTAFANHLAEKLNIPLIIRKASDLLGMYVGENEKNIAEAFREAESKKGLLFIDEADTFLSERSTAGKGWERTMVNEFLTQMEQFTGVLICATNFREIVDSAATRRFVRKVEFDYLDEKGVKALCKTYFGLRGNSKVVHNIVELGYLTPGDFWTIFRNWYFLPKKQRANFDFVTEFTKERKEKGVKARAIGFAA